MSKWRYYPLKDFPLSGVLESPDGKLTPCDCLTPAEAKKRAQRPQQ